MPLFSKMTFDFPLRIFSQGFSDSVRTVFFSLLSLALAAGKVSLKKHGKIFNVLA